MEAEGLTWAQQRQLVEGAVLGEPGAKLVLLMLHSFASTEGAAWPSLGTLARLCDAGPGDPGVRWARKRVRQLEELGAVEREVRTRPNGSQTSNRIVIRFGTLRKLAAPAQPSQVAAGAAAPGVESAPAADVPGSIQVDPARGLFSSASPGSGPLPAEVGGPYLQRQGGPCPPRYPQSDPDRQVPRLPEGKRAPGSSGWFREWQEAFVRAWNEVHPGAAYSWAGAKDTKALQAIHRAVKGDRARFDAAVRRFLVDADGRRRFPDQSMAIFAMRINGYVGQYTPELLGGGGVA